ncbi:hypothetical protein Acr_23g0009620 [Actinidia rufa]|uniref:Uncharacterized protein n=1 Tax=Actinidia rufa TaxID=165716 RepID=A0A7J0GP31_9ERIC|nr:hypothetical protein Acr_23g0009620 [Actinidia rufa]
MAWHNGGFWVTIGGGGAQCLMIEGHWSTMAVASEGHGRWRWHSMAMVMALIWYCGAGLAVAEETVVVLRGGGEGGLLVELGRKIRDGSEFSC